MDRIKEFFKTKGFYIALYTGVAAFATLLLLYNYSDKKNEVRREHAIDLNQNAINTTEENTVAKKVDSDGVIKKKSNKVDSKNEIKDAKIEQKSTSNNNGDITKKDASANKQDVIDPTNCDDEEAIQKYLENNMTEEVKIVPSMNYDGGKYLHIPLIGEVILPYSMDTTVYYKTLDCYRCNPGMLIKGDEGTDIASCYEGIVEKIEDTKEHGTIVVVDMGNGYKATYGQLMNVTVKEKDAVTVGQNIGEIAPVSSYYSKEGNHLYFEVEKDGEPVNPNALFCE